MGDIVKELHDEITKDTKKLVKSFYKLKKNLTKKGLSDPTKSAAILLAFPYLNKREACKDTLMAAANMILTRVQMFENQN